MTASGAGGEGLRLAPGNCAGKLVCRAARQWSSGAPRRKVQGAVRGLIVAVANSAVVDPGDPHRRGSVVPAGVAVKPLDVLLILVSILFATGFIVDQRWGPERRQHRTKVRFQQARLDLIADGVQHFHELEQRYPTTEEGVDVVKGLHEASLSGDFEVLKEQLDARPGVRDMYGIPYVYENRRDVEKSRTAFRASPSNFDRKTRPRWSRRVDKGIYVSSIGLYHDAERVFGRAWLDAVLLFFGGVILFLAIAYVIARNRRSSDRVRGINAMILIGVAILLTVVVGLTNGGKALTGTPPPTAADLASGPRVDLLEEYLAIVQSFADNGVYDPAAAQARIAALREEYGL